MMQTLICARGNAQSQQYGSALSRGIVERLHGGDADAARSRGEYGHDCWNSSI